MKDDEKLLREYVRGLLKENGDMYGYEFASKGEMYSGFIQPFVDVFKTAIGKSKEVTRKARTLLTVGLQAVLTTVVPFIGADYSDLFKKEKEDIDKIRDQYKDVYERTDKALRSNDAALLAFMAFPAAFLGFKAASMAPGALKSLLSAATGGASDELFAKVKQKAEKAEQWSLGKDEEAEVSKRKPKKRKEEKPEEPPDREEAVEESQINEDENLDVQQFKLTPKKVLTNKGFLAKSLASPRAKEMQSAATEIYRRSLDDAYKQILAFFKGTKTVEDLEKVMRGKLKGDVKSKIDEIKKLPPEEKTKAEEILLKGIRDAAKEMYVKNLTERVEGVLRAGIPEDSQFVKDHRAVIQKISNLS